MSRRVVPEPVGDLGPGPQRPARARRVDLHRPLLTRADPGALGERLPCDRSRAWCRLRLEPGTPEQAIERRPCEQHEVTRRVERHPVAPEQSMPERLEI